MPQRCRIPQVKSPHASGSATASTSPAARVPADVCGNAPRRRPSAHVIARPMATTGWGSQRGSPKARSAANPAAMARIVITGHRPPKRGERREGSAHPKWRPMRRPARYARRSIPFSGQLARRAALSRYPRERRRRRARSPGALRFARLPKRRDDAAGEIALVLAMRAARLAPGVYPGAIARILFKLGGASPLEVAEIHLAQTGARHKLRIRGRGCAPSGRCERMPLVITRNTSRSHARSRKARSPAIDRGSSVPAPL